LYALELRQKIGDKKYISVSYNNIGLIYRAKKDYPKAIYYYQNSLKIKQEIRDEQGMIDAYINIGSAFQSSGKSDSNYYFAQKAYLLAQKNNDKSDMIAAESNMAVALVMLNRPKEALVILERIEKSAAR
jgi:tetratricopeptide (TPR) repeat protein